MKVPWDKRAEVERGKFLVSSRFAHFRKGELADNSVYPKVLSVAYD